MSNDLVLSTTSNNEQLKAYFENVIKLSKNGDEFPVNLDEVWPIAYTSKGNAVRDLKNKFEEEYDYQPLINIAKRNGAGGQNEVSYKITVSCMEYLVVRKVRDVFNVYRQVFHAIAEGKFVLMPSYQIEDPIARAETWIKEQKEKIALENKNKKQQKLIEEQKPKADYFDNLVERNLLTNFRDTAKQIGIKQTDLINKLLENGYIYRDKSKKIKPYAQYVDKLFKIKDYTTDNGF